MPASGFDNLNSGPSLAICYGGDFGFTDFTFALETNFYQGKSPGYTVNTYGLHLELSKNNWRFSPVIILGGDYLTRGIGSASESGSAFIYGLGLAMNFGIENLRIYPKLFFEGMTDFKANASFIGFKLGFSYEI